MAIDRRTLLGGLAAGVSAVSLMLARPSRAQSVNYTYDALGRLSTVTYPDGRVTTYVYDAAGNRTQTTTASPPPPTPPPPPLSVGVSPNYWTGDGTYSDPPVVATPTGGTAPNVYLWQRVSGDPAVRPSASSSASTAFYYLSPPVPGTTTASWRCRVTDSLSVIAYSPPVAVTLEP